MPILCMRTVCLVSEIRYSNLKVHTMSHEETSSRLESGDHDTDEMPSWGGWSVKSGGSAPSTSRSTWLLTVRHVAKRIARMLRPGGTNVKSKHEPSDDAIILFFRD